MGGITKEWEDSGAEMEQIERVGKKDFAHVNHAKQSHGYYVQMHFSAEPNVIDDVQKKLKLNENIMLQHYRRR